MGSAYLGGGRHVARALGPTCDGGRSVGGLAAAAALWIYIRVVRHPRGAVRSRDLSRYSGALPYIRAVL
jgi:hypothetical protein